MSDQPVARSLSKTNTGYTQPDMHGLNGIRIHDPSVLASEDILCLRPRGYCNRQRKNTSPCFLHKHDITPS
jgi:hypothetical protein